MSESYSEKWNNALDSATLGKQPQFCARVMSCVWGIAGAMSPSVVFSVCGCKHGRGVRFEETELGCLDVCLLMLARELRLRVPLGWLLMVCATAVVGLMYPINITPWSCQPATMFAQSYIMSLA